MDIIRVEDVSKSNGSRSILSGMSLTIKRGECFTLLGPSGCGKTVLLRLIAGFESPDAGKISGQYARHGPCRTGGGAAGEPRHWAGLSGLCRVAAHDGL